MSRFNDLYWLVEVVEAGTLKGAAQKNNVSNAAVSKRIRHLEDRLGVQLLIRGTRQVRTTEAGELYYQRGKGLLDEFRDLEDNVSSTSETLSGSIRINVPLSFGLSQLSGPVQSFLRQYPNLSINVRLDDGYIDIQNSNYDLVIRIGSLEDSSIIIRRISSANIICCASDTYIQKHGVPHKPEDLKQHNCLVYEQENRYSNWRFTDGVQVLDIPVSGNLISSSGEFLYDAAINGLGIAYLPDFIAMPSLLSGDLQQILKTYTAERVGVYAMYPSRHFLPQKVKRLIEHLKINLESRY